MENFINSFLDLGNINTQIFLVPFIIFFLTIGALRLALGAWRGALLSTFGIGLGYIASYLLIRDIALWPLRLSCLLRGLRPLEILTFLPKSIIEGSKRIKNKVV
jgi:hypothetical protein